MTTGNKHLCIIGGGVIGLCAAYYCARRGHKVTVIDREPADHEGCSYGNAGIVCPSHLVPLAAPGMVSMGLRMMWNPESPFWIKPRLDADLFAWGMKFIRAANPEHVARSAPLLRDLHCVSRACFEEMEAEFSSSAGGGFELVKHGLLMLCQSQHALGEEARAAEFAKSLGVPAEILDAKQTAELDPGATLDIAGAVHFPKDCHLTPARFMAALKAQCARLGVEFQWRTAVNGFTLHAPRAAPPADRIASAQTAAGGITADEFILCGGSWSPLLARQLGLKLPMQPGKGYSLTLPQPRQLPHLCHILTEARVAVTPMGGALRFGGTMEIAGLNEDINPVRVNGIIQSALRYYPQFTSADFDGVQPWCGLRPCSPDGLPYVGRPKRLANLTIATGHAMMGLSLGPVTGRLVSEIVSGEPTSIDIRALSPDRYGG